MPFTSNCQPVVRFHRWSRKGYAIFSSISKTVVIGTLAIGCSIVSKPCKAQHKPDTAQISRILEIDSVVITAQRGPVTASKISRPVQVITQQEIAGAPGRSVENLLEFLPGVDVRNRGVSGIQSDISIRGGTFDQTLILLNGITMSDPHTGHHSMNLPIDPDAIEKIEVLTGPAARVFGANAYNGVVNIITKPSPQETVSIRITGGENRFYNGTGTINLHTGRFHHLLSLSKNGSDGFMPNTDFKAAKAFLHTVADFKPFSVETQAGWSDRGFGANSFYTPKYPDQYEQTRTLNASVKLATRGVVKVTPVAYWRRNDDRFELFRGEVPSWYKNHNYHRSETMGGAINGQTTWRGGRSSVGIEYRHETILSNVLGTPLADPVAAGFGEGVNYTRHGVREIFSLFAEHTLFLGPLTLNAGILSHYSPQQEKVMKYYPGLEAGLSITANLHLSAAFNQTLRLPTFTDLYYTTTTHEANPGLLPEEANVWEAGLRYRLQSFTCELNGFYRAGRNMIDWVQMPGDDKWYSTNITRVNIKGFETSIRYMARLNNRQSGINQLRLSWQFTQSDKSSNQYLSKYVLDNLKQKIDMAADIRLPLGFSSQIKGSYQLREGIFLQWPDNVPTAYRPVWLLDAQIQWKFKQWTLFAEATNLLNTPYTDHAQVPLPGRWIRGGIIYQSTI